MMIAYIKKESGFKNFTFTLQKSTYDLLFNVLKAKTDHKIERHNLLEYLSIRYGFQRRSSQDAFMIVNSEDKQLKEGWVHINEVYLDMEKQCIRCTVIDEPIEFVDDEVDRLMRRPTEIYLNRGVVFNGFNYLMGTSIKPSPSSTLNWMHVVPAVAFMCSDFEKVDLVETIKISSDIDRIRSPRTLNEEELNKFCEEFEIGKKIQEFNFEFPFSKIFVSFYTVGYLSNSISLSDYIFPYISQIDINVLDTVDEVSMNEYLTEFNSWNEDSHFTNKQVKMTDIFGNNVKGMSVASITKDPIYLRWSEVLACISRLEIKPLGLTKVKDSRGYKVVNKKL